MSINEINPSKRRTLMLLRIIFALVLLVTAWILLRHKLPGNMATGLLAGGGATLAVFAFVLWRNTRNPAGLTAIERTLAHAGDERDNTVSHRAFAVMGMASVPLMSAAAIALALGAGVPMVLALMLWAQILVGIGAFFVINRKL